MPASESGYNHFMKDEKPQISYLDKKIASLIIKFKQTDFKKFKLKEIKKEYYMPLALLISTFMIAIAIYLGTTVEYRNKKAACMEVYGKEIKKIKSGKKMILQVCMSKMK